MRIITSETIVRTVKNLCLRANKFLPSDIKLTLDTAYDYEISPNGKRAIGNIIDNYKVSQQTSLPICQDTGMVVVFAEIGQDVHIVGERLRTPSTRACARHTSRATCGCRW